MNRSTLAILGIGLAIGVLVAMVGFRFSFVSADVSVIAKELGDAKVLNVELEADVRRRDAELAVRQRELAEYSQRSLVLQRDLQSASQRANQCESDRSELERLNKSLEARVETLIEEASADKTRSDALKKEIDDQRSRHEQERARLEAGIASRDKRIADLSSDTSEPGRLLKRNAELSEANSRLDSDLQSCRSGLSKLEVKARELDASIKEVQTLRQQVQELRKQVQALTPPTLDAGAPSKIDQWNSLLALQNKRGIRGTGRYDNLAAWDFKNELGGPDVELTMIDLANQEWSEETWRKELFPRYRCARTGWPQPLAAVATCVDLSRTTEPGLLGYQVLIWKLNKDFLGVAVCGRYRRDVGRGTSVLTGDRVLGETTLRRDAFPDLRN
jgi:hypothetical protein